MTAVVSAFRRGEWRTSLDTVALPGPWESGHGLALVPEIVAHADRRWWDDTGRHSPFAATTLAPGSRRELLLFALDLFEHGTVTVGGLGPQGAGDFHMALWQTAGVPRPLARRWTGMLREGLSRRKAPRPDDALALVSLPGNTFTCLDSVLDQAERSAGVWVRPSRREPLSAARLVASMLTAGWPPDRIGLYPTEQRTLHGLVRLTDRQVVYGGAGLAASALDSETLTLHGPGRGCAVVPAGMPAKEAADWLLPLIAADSGRFCSNVHTVACADAPDGSRQDPEPLATALAAALDALHPQPGFHQELVAFREFGAVDMIQGAVRDRLRPGDRILTRRPAVVLGPASEVYARPQLALLDGHFGDGTAATHPLVGHEVPFPFAAVLSASPEAVRAITAASLFVHRPAK
ncbi:hypothetical protein AB0B50_05765 [Streptomyces sp. NPDC041068]|uniref:hypothetical protein n=1 Tax=Streptomyces sp. NPDC041068 TaxID=3155130 RepID=UPI0033DAF9E9